MAGALLLALNYRAEMIMGGLCCKHTAIYGFLHTKEAGTLFECPPGGRGLMLAWTSMCQALCIFRHKNKMQHFFYWSTHWLRLVYTYSYSLCDSWHLIVFSITLNYCMYSNCKLIFVSVSFFLTLPLALLIWFILKSSECTSVERFLWQINKKTLLKRFVKVMNHNKCVKKEMCRNVMFTHWLLNVRVKTKGN